MGLLLELAQTSEPPIRLLDIEKVFIFCGHLVASGPWRAAKSCPVRHWVEWTSVTVQGLLTRAMDVALHD
jgi:hypothetical protein